MKPSVKGWLTVLGGFLIHLVLGTLYCWANLTSAVTSYLRFTNINKIFYTYNDTILIFAAALASQGMTIFIGGLLGQIIGARLTCMLGGYILVFGTYLSALCTSLDYFIICDGFMFGIGLGLCYTSPISCAVRWMPKRKGLVTGIIVGGFGCGAFVFGQLAIHLLNPNRESVMHSGPYAKYFEPNSPVIQRVPYMFVMLSLVYFILITIGSLLLFEPPDIIDDEG